MSERQVRATLQDMLEAANRIQMYTRNTSFEQFQADFKTQDAVLRNLEVLGEGAKNIPEAYRKGNPDMPWKEMARTRDRLIHHYFGVNLDVVWGIVELEIPGIIKQLEMLSGQEL